MPTPTGSRPRPEESPDLETSARASGEPTRGSAGRGEAEDLPDGRRLRWMLAELERTRFERDRAVAAMRAYDLAGGSPDAMEIRGLAHDLRNLLQAIVGHAARVGSLVPEPSEAHSHLRLVQRAAERAAHLTDRLVSPGANDDEPRSCDANAVLSELLDLIGPGAPIGVQFERSFDANLPPLGLRADDLRQIALNLVVNAWQAQGDRGGHVRVETRVARDRGVIEVSDDGNGMEPSVLDRIFEPFFSTRRDGRGLGLATVQTLLRRAGGDVRVSSRPGRGTSFVVGLPLSAPPGEAPAPK